MTSTVAIRPKERDNTCQKNMAPGATIKQRQKELPRPHPAELIRRVPYFASEYGAAFLGDSLDMLRSLPSGQVNLVVTSPPYALHFKKEYGNKTKEEYIKWFLPFASEIHRALRDDGSFVLNIGGSYNQG